MSLPTFGFAKTEVHRSESGDCVQLTIDGTTYLIGAAEADALADALRSPTRPHDRTLYVRPNPRARRQRTVMIDNDAEIVVVLEREAAAAAVTHLQDVVSVLRKTGPAWRCGLVEGVVSELTEQLGE